MTRDKKPDHFDWFGALEASARESRVLAFTEAIHGPQPRCLCGSTDTRGRILFVPVDLTAAPDDLAAEVNEGQQTCRACAHGIAHGARRVTRYYGNTTTVRDHYHPSCVEI